MNIFKAFGGKIVEAASGAYQARINRKIKEAEFANAVHIKKLEAVEQGRINEAEWNNNSIKKAGWRPGYLTVLLSAPLVLAFLPPFVPWLHEGFAVLAEMPVWYRSAVAVMISSGFGYKAYADYQLGKKYD